MILLSHLQRSLSIIVRNVSICALYQQPPDDSSVTVGHCQHQRSVTVVVLQVQTVESWLGEQESDYDLAVHVGCPV